MTERSEFRCLVCGGVKGCEVHPQQPNFRPTICEECEAKREADRRRAKTLSRICRTLPYPSWDPKLGVTPTLAKVKAAARSMTSLYVIGDTGSGKTRAICQAASAKMWDGISVQWRNCAEWSDRLAALAGSSMTDLEREKAAAVSADILILDDLGKGKATERVAATYFDIIDRCIREGTLLWITTNRTPMQLESQFGLEYGAPMVRRIVEVVTAVEVP